MGFSAHSDVLCMCDELDANRVAQDTLWSIRTKHIKVGPTQCIQEAIIVLEITGTYESLTNLFHLVHTQGNNCLRK